MSKERISLAALIVGLVAIAIVTPGPGSATRAPAGARPTPSAGPARPNIVYITTDDQPLATVTPEAMPNLHEGLIERGTYFSDYVVTTPLCCPSRATTMTGQYGHNNGVLRNVYGDLRQKRNVLSVWLQRAGYNTAHIGKFLNEYKRGRGGQQAVAPGWDLWFTQLERRRYYEWKASKNGRLRRFGSEDDDQATSVSTEFAARWTARLVRRRAPFYLQLDYFAPHAAAGRDDRCAGAPVPEPQDEHRFDDYQAPRPPSFNEQDVSDKPPFIRDRPPLDDAAIEAIDQRYRCNLEALYGVDRGIGEVLRTVAAAGELDDTVFVFSSDNGYYFGEHRMPEGKVHAYEEVLHMPLVLRVPPRHRQGAVRVAETDAPVASIDLVPTLLDLAGAEPCRTRRHCRTMDGRSLMPLIDGEGRFPSSRPIRIEIGDCSFEGVRFQREVYFEHSRAGTEGCEPSSSAQDEDYDLDADPFQLSNLASDEAADSDSDRQAGLQRRMNRLETCSGIRGRDPLPEAGSYCK